MPALTKSQVAQLRTDIAAALASVTMKHGVTFSLGTIRFNADSFRAGLTGVALGAGGTSPNQAVTPEELALKKAGARVLGSTYTEGHTYRSSTLGEVKFVGYNSKAHKYPFIVKQVSGKRYKVSVATAKSLLMNDTTPTTIKL